MINGTARPGRYYKMKPLKQLQEILPKTVDLDNYGEGDMLFIEYIESLSNKIVLINMREDKSKVSVAGEVYVIHESMLESEVTPESNPEYFL